MSQSNRCRRLSVAPLAGVERRGRGSLGSGSLAVGISNSLPSGSRFTQGTHPFSGVLSQFDQGQSSGGRGPVFTGQGSDRACSSSFSGLLQPVVCSDESLRSVEAGHRSLSPESEGSADILQDGDSPIRASVSTPGRLDGVSGLEGCVLAGSDASGISQVPQVHGGREGVPVQGSQVFTRVMAPVSAILHRTGVRLRRYLDDWLLQASSREQVLLALKTVFWLCSSLGIVVNWEKSQVIPTQRMVSSELHCAEDSPLGGVSSSCDLPTVHHGEAQRASGCFVSPEPDSGLRMDTETGGLSGSVQEVAGLDRPFCHISKSPMFDIFFTLPRSECSGNGCASSELEWVAGVCLSSLVSNSSSSEEAPVVLWGPSNHHSTLLASEALVSGSSGSGSGWTGSSSSVQRSPAPAPLPSIPSRGVQAVASCLETIQRFTRARGFSKRVAQQVLLARRPSSRAGYQGKWLVFRRWCRSEGNSVSRPSLSKIADFLFWLRRSRRLSVSAVMGYRSMLSAVFKSILPEISTSPTLHDLLRSFQVEAPVREVRPPSWDLPTVLNFLRSSPFEPLSSASLRDLTCKALFLIALATAKRVGELQALSRLVSFSSSAAGLSYVPEFVAKTETATRPLPRSFEVQSLGDFAAGLPEELLLCVVRSLSAYMTRTSQVVNRPRRLFVSPKCPSRAMSKNGISYMLREVIVQSGTSSQSGQAPRAHSIRGIATSSAFFRNWRAGGGLLAFKCHFYILLLAGFTIYIRWSSFFRTICCCW